VKNFYFCEGFFGPFVLEISLVSSPQILGKKLRLRAQTPCHFWQNEIEDLI